MLDSKARIFYDLRDVDFNNTQLDVKYISYHMLVKWAFKLVSEQDTA